jgi:transcriptional regulator with XRE-family HTH domain
MNGLNPTREARYSFPGMPQARRETGPWGDAVQYWLNHRQLRQADLVRATRIQAKTISQIARGFHTTTKLLGRIAAALNVPLDQVLVSPLKRGTMDDRRRLISGLMEDVLRFVDVAGDDTFDRDTLDLARRIYALPAQQRESVHAVVAGYELHSQVQTHAPLAEQHPPVSRASSPPAVVATRRPLRRRARR